MHNLDSLTSGWTQQWTIWKRSTRQANSRTISNIYTMTWKARTIEMEIVARANGSPKILLDLNLAILRGDSGIWFGLWRDGECVEYVTMNGIYVAVGEGVGWRICDMRRVGDLSVCLMVFDKDYLVWRPAIWAYFRFAKYAFSAIDAIEWALVKMKFRRGYGRQRSLEG